jgi:hypothetical protein
MNDGAHVGVGAKRALDTILGGDPSPTEEECETVEQMRERILAAPIEAKDYDGAATACARLILEAWKKYPQLVEVPHENIYLKDEAGNLVIVDDGLVQLVPGLHAALKSLYRDRQEALEILTGLTGFMWGWAVNAANRCLDLPPVANPALLEIA